MKAVFLASNAKYEELDKMLSKTKRNASLGKTPHKEKLPNNPSSARSNH